MDFQVYFDWLVEKILQFSPNVIAAILILVIGFWITKRIVKLLRKVMSKRGIDETLQKFLGDLIGWALKVLIIVVAISQVGVESTSFIAILGAAGLAIGLALQGSLANFAG